MSENMVGRVALAILNMPPAERENAMEVARTAIEAMRKPTALMLRAATAGDNYGPRERYYISWLAAIDAALGNTRTLPLARLDAVQEK